MCVYICVYVCMCKNAYDPFWLGWGWECGGKKFGEGDPGGAELAGRQVSLLVNNTLAARAIGIACVCAGLRTALWKRFKTRRRLLRKEALALPTGSDQTGILC